MEAQSGPDPRVIRRIIEGGYGRVVVPGLLASGRARTSPSILLFVSGLSKSSERAYRCLERGC